MPTLSPSDVLAGSSFVATQLDQAKRRGLAALAALWGLADPDDIPGSLALFLPFVVQLMHQQQAAGRVAEWTQAQLAVAVADGTAAVGSAELSISAGRDGRMLSGSTFEQVIAPTVPGALSRIRSGMDPMDALNVAQRIQAVMVGSVAHDEARSTTQDVVTSQTGPARHLNGYARRTEGAFTCKFCRMLATRGPVYSKDTAGFRAHAFCDCTTYAVSMADHVIDPGDWDAHQSWAKRTPKGASSPTAATTTVPAATRLTSHPTRRGGVSMDQFRESRPPRLSTVESLIASYEPVLASGAGTQWMREQMPRLYAERDQLLTAVA